MERLTRRQVLARGAATAGTLAAGGPLAACGGSSAPRRSGPQVVVVGAGLAGLTCALRLHRAGIPVRVFEAQYRVGGRCWSTRRRVPGLVAEHGGELIDTGHRRIRALARSLGLELVDLAAAADRARGEPALLVGERRLREETAYAGWEEIVARAEADAARIGSYRHDRAGDAARAFDERSAADWIAANAPGTAGRMLAAELTGAFGLDPPGLSAIAVLQHLTGPDTGPEERFRVVGGNDQIPRKLAAALPERALSIGSTLEGLWRRQDGRYAMDFDSRLEDVVADHVVLAIPPTTLRAVDLTRSGLPPERLRLIAGLTMGAGAKLLLPLRERPAAFSGWDGHLDAAAPALFSWDTALAQPGTAGLLTAYFGGRAARELPAAGAHGPAPGSVVEPLLERLELVAPGVRRAYAGGAWLDAWPRDRWVQGSYAAYRPGEVTRWWGLAGRPHEGLHFAGEHTSLRAQGYLEGAVESGERTAREILGSR